MFKKDVVLAQEYLGFLLLNLFDLMLTGLIFRHSGQEANGLALWVLHHFGLMGFAIFKFLMVVFIILVCEAISFHSVDRAKQVITGACVLYVLVIMWEVFLISAYINKPLLAPKPVAIEHHQQDTRLYLPDTPTRAWG